MGKEEKPAEWHLATRFQQLYSRCFYSEVGESEFTAFISSVVKEEDLDGLKYIAGSLREIGTHASIGPSEQLKHFHNWIRDTDEGEELSVKFADMAAAMILPDDLPDFQMEVKYEDVDEYDEIRRRDLLDDLLYFNTSIERKSVESKEIFIDAATKLLESEKSTVEIERSENAIELLAAGIIMNQFDRRYEKKWWALMRGEDGNELGRLSELDSEWGFYGLISIPTEDGRTDVISEDIAPKAFDEYIRKMEREGEEKTGLHIPWTMLELEKRYGKEGIDKLIELTEIDSWPEWAKENIEEYREYSESASEEED